MAHVPAGALEPDAGVTVVAERLVAVFDEAQVGQLLAAHVAAEAGRVPAPVHRLNHAADDELVWMGETAGEEMCGGMRQRIGKIGIGYLRSSSIKQNGWTGYCLIITE